MSKEEAAARWLYSEINGWMTEYYLSQDLEITPWDDVPPSIQDDWIRKASDLLAVIDRAS